MRISASIVLFLLILMLSAAPVSAQHLEDFTLIAHYPLSSDADDITDNHDPMILTNTTFEDGGIFCNGLYTGDNPSGCDVVTPFLDDLSLTSYAISVDCKIHDFDNMHPIVVGGSDWKWMVIYTVPDRKIGLGVNGLYTSDIPSDTRLSVDTWNTLTFVYHADDVSSRLYVNDVPVDSAFIEIDHHDDKTFSITHGSLGHTFKGYLKNLKVYTKTESLTPIQQDSLALVALYNSTNGPGWTNNTNWLTREPVSTWHGIIVLYDRVVRVDLSDNNLNGSLPTEIGNLSKLAYLGLTNNSDLVGPIPPEIGNLTELEWLELYNNGLTGSIPTTIGNLTKVTRMDLTGNDLSGAIPAEIGQMTDLTEIILRHNQLDGPIPSTISNLDKLLHLYLDSNRLEGSIPNGIYSLSDIETLNLEHNQLTGNILSGIGNLTNLVQLKLGFNYFDGTIPPDIGNLAKLKVLYINATSLEGQIPSTIGNLTELEQCILSANNLTGSIPSGIGNLSKLVNLRLYQNRLTGAIPGDIGRLSNLTQLWLNHNRLDTTLPVEICNMSQLEYLYVQENQLSGAIPQQITNLSKLKIFKIHHNNIDAFPDVSSIATLNELFIQNNRLTFEHIVPNMAIANFQYAPQDSVGEKKLQKVNHGSTFTMTVEVGGPNNAYQWYKDDVTIVGAINKSLTINSASEQDAGAYICVITNPDAPDLTLIHRPFIVTIRGLGLEQDSLALVDLYNSTDGAHWINRENWLTSEPVATWHGITVEDGRVYEISLVENNLDGPLPPRIGNLTMMVKLSLGRNQLAGNLPLSLFNLNKLKELKLYSNKLSGSIPDEIARLDSLEVLELFANQLTGSIPSQIGLLTQLRHVNLSFNQLEDVIPDDIFNLTRLTGLRLNANQLTGSIPASISNLSNLDYLDLGQNELSGPIPNEIGSLSKLTYLLLGDNQFDGSIPAAIGNLAQLRSLTLDQNQLSGTIPHEIGNLSELQSIYLYENQLVDGVPDEWVNLKKLEYLYLYSNQLDELPDISSISALKRAKVERNRLTFEDLEPNMSIADFQYSPQDSFGREEYFSVEHGSSLTVSVSVGGTQNNYQWRKDGNNIPNATNSSLILDPVALEDDGLYVCKVTNDLVPNLTLFSMPKIVTIQGYDIEQDSLALVALCNSTDGANWTNKENWLSQNPLSTWFGITVQDGRVTAIELPENGLAGTIPESIGDVNKLQNLDLSENNLSGAIPTTIGQLTNLEYLSLGSNQLSGRIPKEIANLTKLSKLYMSWNDSLTTIPDEIGNLVQLKILYLAGNNISELPETVFNLTNLTNLSLGWNKLSGPLPTQLGQLTKLRYLYLDGNQYTGTIPDEFFTLSNLFTLDLGNNDLSGSIPSDIGTVVNLTTLRLGGNQFDGSLPVDLFDLENLKYLELQDNQFTGKIPSEIGKLVDLERLYVNNNQLSDSLPSSIGNLTRMRHLHVHNNDFTHGVPPQIVNMTNLYRMYAYHNQFVDFPDVSALDLLENLSIGNNKLTFEDIEPNIGIENFAYTPQDSVGTQVDTTVHSGSAMTLFVNVGGTANLYQWTRDRKNIDDATSSTLSLEDIQPSDSGTYVCRVTNSIATDLTLYSRPVIVRVSIDSDVALANLEIPIDFALFQNYPNPFNPKTTIKYQLPTVSHINIILFDVLGRIVRVLKDEKQEAGYYTIDWDGKDEFGNAAPSGTYLYRLETENFTQTRKLLLIR